MAFYDALATNEAAVRELGDDTLKKIAVELVAKLRSSVTVDWSKRETVRARLRVMVKTLLKRYKYPPDRQEEATDTVLSQAESLSLLGSELSEQFFWESISLLALPKC